MWQLQVFLLELKKLSSYRVDFWLRLVVAALVKIGLGYYLWQAMFTSQGVDSFAGMTLNDLILYYVSASFISNIVMSGFGTTTTEIYDGTLTRYLLYPVSFYQYKFAMHLAYWTLAVVQFLAAIFLLSACSESINIPSLTLLFKTLIACFFASYLYIIMQSILEFLSFWIEGIWGLMISLYFIINFLGGGVLPVKLFPAWSIKFLEATPFPWMINFPAEVVSNKVDAQYYLYGLMIMISWCVFLTLISCLIWKRGLKQYSSVGI